MADPKMTAAELLAMAQGLAEREMMTSGSVTTSAYLITRGHEKHMMVMPDLSEQEARYQVTWAAEQHDGVLVSVVHEKWVVLIPDDAAPEVRQRLEAAAINCTLDQQP